MATKDIEPDVILPNGRIATQDRGRLFAQAVAIQNGRFTAIGSNEQIMRGARLSRHLCNSTNIIRRG